MHEARCAVAILPAGDGDAARLLRSLASAKAHGTGDLKEIVALPVHPGDARAALEAAAEAAEAEGFDWLLAVNAAETLSPDIFVKATPALRLHDAVWGAAGVATLANPDPKVERATRLAAQDPPTFFHAALRWWIGPSHFVRPAAAFRALNSADTSAWYADYMIALWKGVSAYKTAQRLTLFHDALPPVPGDVKARLVERLAAEPVFMTVTLDGQALRLPYTGLNPVIEREQMRGLFFEAEELRFLAGRLPRGLRIADVGANTGNHTVYLAGVMAAERVVPIEPDPRAAAALRAAVTENALSNVDLSRLGVAAGADTAMLRAVPSATAGLGAMHFVPDPLGSVPQRRLDELLDGPIDFLKIDVEGMEMAVLAGAAGLVSRYRPHLYIEVVDESIAEFMDWADRNRYHVEKLFPDKTHCNYFLSAD